MITGRIEKFKMNRNWQGARGGRWLFWFNVTWIYFISCSQQKDTLSLSRSLGLRSPNRRRGKVCDLAEIANCRQSSDISSWSAHRPLFLRFSCQDLVFNYLYLLVDIKKVPLSVHLYLHIVIQSSALQPAPSLQQTRALPLPAYPYYQSLKSNNYKMIFFWKR